MNATDCAFAASVEAFDAVVSSSVISIAPSEDEINCAVALFVFFIAIALASSIDRSSSKAALYL
ncbi:hypothetical protein [Agathobacter rectalis]|uniref:hypothetical protein n=1 Tax=Agathobacter rectalis TaxID=39491 RepID=UPI0027D2C0D7|nr:hypothetical protein [Agathobacter rectalis]